MNTLIAPISQIGITYQEYQIPKEPIIPDELEDIVAITNSGLQMLPLTTEKLKSHKLAIVAKLGETVVGYCAATYHYKQDNFYEVGALVVLPEYRQHGIATELIKLVTALTHTLGHNAIAFCNPASEKIFQLENNYSLAAAEQVPQEAIAPCDTCPMKTLHKNGVCCDNVYVKMVKES